MIDTQRYWRRKLIRAIPSIQRSFPGICPHCDCIIRKISEGPEDGDWPPHYRFTLAKDGLVIYRCSVTAFNAVEAKYEGWLNVCRH